MKALDLHRWDVSPREAIQIQNQLREKVIYETPFRELEEIRWVAGCDLSLDTARGILFGGVIVYSFPDLGEVERKSGHRKVAFPYVPGLLAFREGPVLLEVLASLRHDPDVLIFDGQGRAHPRGLGIASHLGLFFDKPSVGCAKSNLCGTFTDPGPRKGEWSPIIAREGQAIGAVLRTRDGVRPIFVSPGHRMDMAMSLKIALGCLDKTRIPKPTREADHFVESLKSADLDGRY